MTDTITTADGRDIPLASDPDEVEAVAVGLTVSTTKKANLGNYENVEPFASLKMEVRPAVVVDVASLERLRTLADNARRVTDHHVNKAIEDAT